MSFLSGFVAIIGPPNVGKSTLLNKIMGTRVSIVSSKPQTTRNRIVGIFHEKACQIVFMDTPGIHRTRTALHQSMVDAALAAVKEVDMVLLMVAANAPEDPAVPGILKSLGQAGVPALLAINKIDRIPRKTLLPLLEDYGSRFPFEALVPISALKGDGLEQLLQEMKRRLLPGPQFFPPDMHTDQSEVFLISEIIREKVYDHMHAELPYACAVTVLEMADLPEKNLLKINAALNVETPSQKAIFIGQRGRMIKKIGQSARLELESLFASKVYLNLRVRVEKNWTRDSRALERLGY